MNLELRSSPPPPLEQAVHPSAGPLQYHPRPPPAVVEERRVAYIKTARWIKSKDNSSAASMRGSSGNPRCSKTWHSNLDINRGIASARARSLRWTYSSKCNNAVMTSLEGLNQNPLDIQNKASIIAPLHYT